MSGEVIVPILNQNRKKRESEKNTKKVDGTDATAIRTMQSSLNRDHKEWFLFFSKTEQRVVTFRVVEKWKSKCESNQSYQRLSRLWCTKRKV